MVLQNPQKKEEIKQATRLFPDRRKSRCPKSPQWTPSAFGLPLNPLARHSPHPIASKSVIIFDWDDTLLPSADLLRLGLLPKTLSDTLTLSALSQIERERVCGGLQKLEETVYQLLYSALRCVGNGHVFVVTNAVRGWIESTCSKFMPSVMKLLTMSTFRIISARSLFERQYPSSPIEWKQRAIKLVLDELLATDIDISRVSDFRSIAYSKSPRIVDVKQVPRPVIDVLQVVSIGDSLVERQAVFEVTKCINFKDNGVKSVRTKSVKLMGTPTIHLLLDELSTIQRTLEQILSTPHDLDYQL